MSTVTNPSFSELLHGDSFRLSTRLRRFVGKDNGRRHSSGWWNPLRGGITPGCSRGIIHRRVAAHQGKGGGIIRMWGGGELHWGSPNVGWNESPRQKRRGSDSSIARRSRGGEANPCLAHVYGTCCCIPWSPLFLMASQLQGLVSLPLPFHHQNSVDESGVVV